MTVLQPPNAGVQLIQDGKATPYFLKLLGDLCATAAGGLDARVSTLETSVATLTGSVSTINTTVGSQGTTLAGHTTHLNALPTSRLSGSTTYNPPNLIAGATTTTTVTVSAAVLGMAAEASFSLDLAGLEMTAYVSSGNTVTVVLVNPTAGAIDLASGTLTCFAWNP
jgi:uncharacterized coiled-coil protein SlyX